MSSTLPDYCDALRAALAAAASVERTEQIALNDSACRVLAESIVADRDLPPFNRAQMDGYALRAADVRDGVSFPVVGEIPAGASGEIDVPFGSCVKIATGAPLPHDCDTVVQHEMSDRANPVHFTIDEIDAGHAVHPRGADAKEGDIVIAAHTQLRAHHLGIAAAVGRATLSCAQRPRAMILTSGDEVRDVDQTVEAHQIRNSNGVLLRSLLRQFGADDLAATHVPDDPDATMTAFSQAINDADFVVTVGGISAGERDYFPDAMRRSDVSLQLHGAAIQPGKPVIVGRAPKGAVVVGLPGNPVSCLVCACLFVQPLIRKMLGLETALPWRSVTLAETVKPNPRRRAFRPAMLQPDGDSIIVPKWAGSGDLAHTATTTGIVELPIQSEHLDAGATLRYLAWPSGSAS